MNMTGQQVKDAINTIVKRFKKVDPRWICSEHDRLGMYRFLTGPNSHTMKEAIPDVQNEVDLIIRTVEAEYQLAAA